MRTPIIIRWSWKGEPDWQEVNNAVLGMHGARFFRICTDEGDYAAILGDFQTEEEAQAYFDNNRESLK